MARSKTSFVCQNCGATATQWSGRCDACGEWNSIVAELLDNGVGAGPKGAKAAGQPAELVPLNGISEQEERTICSINELDRVTGGGFVRGSAVLVGGDPGIGKSTLLLQAAAKLADRRKKVIYVSGEEAIAQIRLRAKRLGVGQAQVDLASQTNVETILATLEAGDAPDLVIIDSIQTLWTDRVESAPGTVSQVRTSAQAMTRFAKKTGACVVLVGHVTKDGQIAGPRVVEHMVDAVLYFEGDASHTFRILRAVKNRYGPTDEIGVFEMGPKGLVEVKNPSALFLDQRDEGAAGSAVFAGIEGTRPVLIEIQALVAPSPLGTPRRAVVGWDGSRLSMVLAVLETRCGIKIGANDIYLNVAGGLKISEPAADMAVAAALISSLSGAPLPADAVYFGEISLSGGIRPVVHTPLRLREAAKLGFKSAYAGRSGKGEIPAGLKLHQFSSLGELAGRIAAGKAPPQG
ncbi:DNA repair protein RadA [hydrothermal vent metagenome]|uniref:DNA repair protein RadA n=1 Tax=hydrothermal vent metagenome TaxID=652676 RepID=A0A3B0U2Z7_9ZZZZ